MNANLIFKWLHDPRFAPDPELATAGVPCFLPVEIVDQALDKDEPPVVEAGVAKGTIEIEHAGGQGDSEKMHFCVSCDEGGGLPAIILNQFNGSGG